jgi:hypothetical protein
VLVAARDLPILQLLLPEVADGPDDTDKG